MADLADSEVKELEDEVTRRFSGAVTVAGKANVTQTSSLSSPPHLKI